jgi:hypothetical protein
MLQNPAITQRNLPILSIMYRNAPAGSVQRTPGVHRTWIGHHHQVQRTPGVHRTIATMVDTRATTCNMK